MIKGLHAAGKVILLGEHAVVYERPALAVGLARGLRALRLEPASMLRVAVPAWGLDAGEDGEGMVCDALRALRNHLPALRKGFSLEVEALLPVGAGLGSSAALSVLAARAFGHVNSVDLDDATVNEAAYAMESVFHGTSSGLDNTVATFGGVCLFRGGDGEGDGKRITPQAVQLNAPAPRLLIAASGVPRETHRMVAGLRARLERDPAGTAAAFDRIAGLVRSGVLAINQGDERALGDAMNMNHEELVRLGLSISTLDRLVALARAAGSPGAKLTGAGGGGCVIALPGSTPDSILDAWTDSGYDCWDTTALDDGGPQ